MNTNWKNITIDLMAEQVGPVAQIIVHDAIENLSLQSGLMTPSIYDQFLTLISAELPSEINSLEFRTICREQAM